MAIGNLLPVVGEFTLLSGFSRIFRAVPPPSPASFYTIKSHNYCLVLS